MPGLQRTRAAAAWATATGWAIALPGHGSPSYAGQFSICVRGRGVLWNAFWSWDPDLECVKLVAELTRMAATPVPKPTLYPMADSMPGGAAPALTDASMTSGLTSCDAPASDKPVRTAAAAKGNGKPKAQKVGGCKL
jgi:hypothetical protein